MTEFMDAVVTTANENEPLALMTIPVPEMAEKDVLVKVAAVAVNPVDAKQRDAAVASNATRVLGLTRLVKLLPLVKRPRSLRRVTEFSMPDNWVVLALMRRSKRSMKIWLLWPLKR